ncbi:ABC transporter permease [Companilactobacillus kedongensis]|uniref:ABC transporter permease n=1 Tax=Companilactobacillus kedongensis TaxID=2486004 RepID=UPI000F774C8E|nr:ABC transporter permease [Companilactobacillus kedongensis]
MKRSTVLLLSPGLLLIIVLLILPILQMFLPTFVGDQFFLEKYLNFFHSSGNIQVILRTLMIAVITTLITLSLGLPTAYWMSRLGERWKKVVSIIVLFPILTNAVVRNFAWITILGKNGVINNLLMQLHLIEKPMTLLYTNFSIVIGSVYLFLPIMITSLVSSFSQLNFEVEEAASVIGARPSIVFFKVILPQLSVGMLTGSILVFVGSLTAYTTPQLLGGNKNMVLATLLQQQSITLGDWTSASVVAVILTVIAVLVMTIMNYGTKLMDRRNAK